MAKKAVDKSVSPGQGKKWCGNPDCDQVVAARSMVCKECGYEFIPKSKPTVKRSAPRGEVDLDALSLLTKEVGGIEKLGKILEMLEEVGTPEAILAKVDEFERMKALFAK